MSKLGNFRGLTIMSTIVMNAPVTKIDQDDLRIFAATRDPLAFERLARRYIDVVYTFCRRQLADPAMAEDVTQAVFVLLAQKAGSIKSNVILSGWLFDAARYCCLNARRSESRRAFHESEAAKLRGQVMNNTDPSIGLENQELDAALHEAMTGMKSHDREVLLLRFFEKQTHSQLAETLGVTEEAAKHRIKRALEKLRSIMSRHEGVTAASLAALPVWMESNALISAPQSLASAAAQGGATANAASHVSFQTGSKLASGLAIKLAMAGVASTLIGAAIVMQLQSPPKPVAAVPASPAATMPAAPAVVRVDFSSPVETLRTISAGMKALDVALVRRCLALSDDAEGRLFQAAFELEVVNRRIQLAARTAFGPRAVITGITDITTDDMVDRTLEHLTPIDVQIDGDRATIRTHVGADLLAKVPEMSIWEGAPAHFVRDAEGWKFAPAKTMVHIAIDNQGKVHRFDPVIYAENMRAITAAANEILVEIQAGRVTDVRTASSRVRETIRREQDARKVVLPPGMVSTLSAPRGVVEAMGVK